MRIFILLIILVIPINCFAAIIQSGNVSVKGITYQSINTAVPKILTMGDSNTEGIEDYGNREFAYRRELQVQLGVGNYDMVGSRQRPSSDPVYDVDHAGVGGNTSAQIEARLQGELDANMTDFVQGDTVIILAGTNDGKLDTTQEREDARDNVEDMIDIIEAFNSNIRILVCSIWPTPDANEFFGEMIDSDVILYNGILQTMVEGHQATNSNLFFVDVHTTINENTRGLCPTRDDCLYGDFYHPNENGLKSGARAMADTIKLGCAATPECTAP